MSDVAHRARVSRGTVSNVLNHPDRVAPATREVVEAAMADLGFVRHEGARLLRAGYSNTIGLLLLDSSNPGFMDVARGVEDVAFEHGLAVLISNSARDSRREEFYLRRFTEHRVDGMIVLPHDTARDGTRGIRANGMPVVLVDRAERGERTLSVAFDDVAGGHLAATHLLELGHRHLAFAGTPEAANPVRDRLEGVRRAVEAWPAAVELTALDADLTVEDGRSLGERLSRLPAAARPTGVIAAIDLVAFGLMQGLLSQGVRVPEDVSLVGYDDITFARQLAIPLTSVSRSHYEMGETAAELLISAIGGATPERRHVVFQPTLSVRRSSAPVAGAAGR